MSIQTEAPSIEPEPTESPTFDPVPAMMFYAFLRQMAMLLLLISLVFHALAFKYGCFKEFVGVLKDGSKRFNFSGRASRYEFVSYSVSQFLILLDAAILDVLVGTNVFVVIGVFWFIVYLVLVIPGYAVTVRRIHDLGQTGLWVLAFILIPSVGQFGTLFLCSAETQLGDNKYGPSPAASATSDTLYQGYQSASTREAAFIPIELVNRGVASTGFINPPVASFAEKDENSAA